MKICKKCICINEDGSSVCSECGADISGERKSDEKETVEKIGVLLKAKKRKNLI